MGQVFIDERELERIMSTVRTANTVIRYLKAALEKIESQYEREIVVQKEE